MVSGMVVAARLHGALMSDGVIPAHPFAIIVAAFALARMSADEEVAGSSRCRHHDEALSVERTRSRHEASSRCAVFA